MVHAVRKPADKLCWIDALPMQLTRVECEAEFVTTVEGIQGPFGGVEVKSDLTRVHLQGEPDAGVPARVEHRVASACELPIRNVHDLGRGGRVAADKRPQRRPAKPSDHRGTEFLSDL